MQVQDYFSSIYRDAVQPILVVDQQLQPVYHNEAFSDFSDRAGLLNPQALFEGTIKEQAVRCIDQLQGATISHQFIMAEASLMLIPNLYEGESFLVIFAHWTASPPDREATLRIFRNSYDRMRTYLNEIYGMVQLFGKEGAEGKQIGEGVRRLLRMANHLYLALDREGRMEYRVPLDLDRFLENYLESVDQIAGRRVSYARQQSGLCVRVMPEDLELILGMLLSNAFRFGGEDVLVKLKSTKEKVILSLWDSGDGAEQPEHLFEWGYRTSDKKGRKGLGYSLPLAKLLLKQQGASIQYCRSDGGTVFEIEMERAYLPVSSLAEWKAEPIEDSLSQLRIELSDL